MGGNHHSAHHHHSHGNNGHHHSGGDHDHNGSAHAKISHTKPGGNTGGSSHGYGSHHGGAQKKGHTNTIKPPPGRTTVPTKVQSRVGKPSPTGTAQPSQAPKKTQAPPKKVYNAQSWAPNSSKNLMPSVNKLKTYNYTNAQPLHVTKPASGQHLFPAMGAEINKQSQNVVSGWQRAWNTITSWFGG